MPFCEVRNTANNGIKIFYKTYGNGPIKVLMIIGVAGTHDSWNPQVEGLLAAGTTKPNDNDHNDRTLNGIQVCVFDNRGMGRSSVPKNKSDYTTKIMAADAISLMDHLGWNKAHVFGHSMGGMIACKLAATYPNRVLSLALLNVTGGGYECFPKIDGLTLSIAMRFLRAKTPEQRAAVDLDTHYSQCCKNRPWRLAAVHRHDFWHIVLTWRFGQYRSKIGQNRSLAVKNRPWRRRSTPVNAGQRRSTSDLGVFFPDSRRSTPFNFRSREYLEEYVGLKTRRDILYQDYVKGISASGMQSNFGFDGQINACWTHKVSTPELQVIHEEGFLISIIHGRHDVIAQMSHAQRLAEKLYPLARMVELPGGHHVSHERTKEVNEALMDLIRASETKTSPYDWTNLSPNSSSCWTTSWSSSSKSNSETESSNPATNDGNAGKLRLIMLYVFGLFVVAFEYIKRGLIRLKPARVGPALT